MSDDTLKDRLAKLGDEELRRMLSEDYENYTPQERRAADTELGRRGVLYEVAPGALVAAPEPAPAPIRTDPAATPARGGAAAALGALGWVVIALGVLVAVLGLVGKAGILRALVTLVGAVASGALLIGLSQAIRLLTEIAENTTAERKTADR